MVCESTADRICGPGAPAPLAQPGRSSSGPMSRLGPRGGLFARAARTLVPSGEFRTALALVLVPGCVAMVIVAGVAVSGAGVSAPEGLRIVITSASLAIVSPSAYYLSLTVANVGDQPVYLTSLLENQSTLLGSQAFAPNPLGPGHSASVVQSVSDVGHFSGTGAYVTVPNSPQLNPSTFTLSFSFEYRNFSPDRQMLVGKGAGTPNSFYFYSYRSVNNINDFVVYANGTRFDQQLGDLFSPGQWYAVAFVDTGQNFTAYVNGRLVATWNHAVDFLGNPDPFLIGICGCGGYDLNASVSSVLLYDRPLSSSEIASNYRTNSALRSGLVLDLDFAGANTTSVPDLSGLGNAGTIVGNVTIGPPLVPGAAYTVSVLADGPGGEVLVVSAIVRS